MPVAERMPSAMVLSRVVLILASRVSLFAMRASIIEDNVIDLVARRGIIQ
jgi:hypothetical protein